MEITAVEWLVEQFDLTSDSSIIKNVIAKAKEIEKEQITNAYIECWENDGGNGFHKVDEAEQYYNRTFKSE